MKLVVGSGGVPVGSYMMEFCGYEEVPADKDRGFGAALRWKFVITEGKYKDSTVSRITTPSPTLKNACGKMLSAIIGKPLTAGDGADLDEHIGVGLIGQVAETESGATRVESVMRPPIG